ncbi:ribosome assembly cofactor RimP [Flavobacterium alvei]|uniref:Ribosome maturation factor RimP n=1 Tax=Flavobacterium alvei TaxID=2080416 RepID=A0A2S5ACF6_9FLAO|nr:ribosome assembly cofactor RimP [Flavobacterium alvei]POY40234.1 ribosome assembly cofactor RimP [Flavobacterium alvei]HQE34493.1 ribosome assembly cofactor RimP [Flavobacterium alvei]HQK39415.1 ribosome assembly cofactor RimP [Flavobacterium alvei]
MTFKDKVNGLVIEALLEKPSVFLIDLTITDSFKIIVNLDGDNGVALQDCIDISRAIENNLDREEQDFSLEVASVGVGSPLKMVRQYKKNVGRTLIVKLATETIEAELVEANDNFIILSWKAREAKKLGKGKETVQKRQEIPYVEIKEAIVTVTF